MTQCFSSVTTLTILNRKEDKFIEQMNASQVSTLCIDFGVSVVNAGMCQLVLSDEILFSFWGVSLFGGALQSFQVCSIGELV